MLNKRILLPVDTSDHSLKSVQYIAKMFPSEQTEVVLFHVYSQLEDFFSSLDIAPDPNQYKLTDLLKSHKALLDDFMVKARSVLLESGFSESNITIKMKLQSLPSIAMEILEESRSNYHVIVVGRTGISQLNEYLGNTAASLVNSVKHIPLIVVDHVPSDNNVLIAYDASESANRAVDSLGELLEGTSFNVTIYHVVKALKYSLIGIIQILPSKEFEDQYYKKHRDDMKVLIEEAQQRLIEKGIGEGQLSTEIDVGLNSRAHAILAKSKKDNYGTIVVGRRGERLTDIDIGTVGRKLVGLASNATIWIVS